MPRKGTKRDPLLDCPIVKIYRDVVHLQLNYIQREFVAANVSCCERGQRLWRASLVEWMLKGFNPKNVPGVVKLWETQYFAVEPAQWSFKRYEVNQENREIQHP